jgi:hypothetical protein
MKITETIFPPFNKVIFDLFWLYPAISEFLFQRSRLKYEKLTDGRRTTDGRQVMAIPHMTLWVRWAKKEMIFILAFP